MPVINSGDIDAYFKVVKHEVNPTVDSKILSAFVIDRAGRPLFPVSVIRGKDIRGTAAAKFLKDIHLEYSEFVAIAGGAITYRDYLDILESGRLL